ncbi:AMP-binding protein, partial [Acidisphaera sp. L21]|uniref:AMP-binding protein n=1 Tax=Acidisphaera sp. L21 TaxID=1641851 RepID=UPI00131C4BB7
MTDDPGLCVQRRTDGSTLIRTTSLLSDYALRVTDRLLHWAAATPDATFLAERAELGWRRLTYGQAATSMRRIAQGLLKRDLTIERPVLVLSGNGIDHALVGLACLHVGIPYVPISAAYSLASNDTAKLRSIVALTTPGLIVAFGEAYGSALDWAKSLNIEVLDNLEEMSSAPTRAVDIAAARVDGETVAKLLFTSGSTGAPKAVINTQRMLCSNQAMLAARFEFLAEEPPVLLDWLPWSHTFGGNHNLNLVLFNGGTMFIDKGRPTPGGFDSTIEALHEISPTLHLTVPLAWQALASHLRQDPVLNQKFFSRLRVPFFAAASLPQPLWDELERLSQEATGKSVPMITGLGCTETAPFALCTDGKSANAGSVGLPVTGIALKLAPTHGKLELRVRGPNVTPGYWRDATSTGAAFDEEGYYRMGDA